MTTAFEIITQKADGEDKGKRLDKWLTEWTGMSRSRLKALILDSRVECAGKPVLDPSSKVIGDANYQVTIPAPVAAIPEPEDIPLDVLYEDEYLIVVNKPAGMTVHPAVGNWTGTLVNALLFALHLDAVRCDLVGRRAQIGDQHRVGRQHDRGAARL